MELGAQNMFHECHCNELKPSEYGPFQATREGPWQFRQKKRRIPLDSPIMQTLNLTYDPPEVWCPVKEVVTSNQMTHLKVHKINKERPSLGPYPGRELEGSSCDLAGISASS